MSNNTNNSSHKPLVSVENLCTYFIRKVPHKPANNTSSGDKLRQTLLRKKETIHAVNGVSLDIQQGETLGLVGESGCGKSTLGRTILRLLNPTSGRILFKGQDISQLSQRTLRPLRREMQMIFQDPYASLNPRMTIGATLAEPLRIHKLVSNKEQCHKKVSQLLDKVGLPKDASRKYPHEFSGGQRQRVGIARALAVQPRFIVCDEPTSALDVSVQAQIINLLQDLQKEENLTYLFISHDLDVVEHICDRVAIMYLGKIVESEEAYTLYRDPKHPYTQALFSAIPSFDQEQQRKRIVLHGDVPSPAYPPSGCAFHPRCPVQDKPSLCTTQCPSLEPVQGDRHLVSCHIVQPQTVL